MTAITARRYALWVAGLYLVTIIAGSWGESHVPDMLLVPNNVAGTAHRLAESLNLFRASFAAYLLEACCDITLNVLLYALLRPVSANGALLALCFGLMATAIYAAGELFYFAAALPAIDSDVAQSLDPASGEAFSYFCLTAYGYVNGAFAVFYGIAAALRGSLMIRSGYLSSIVGVLFMAGGLGYLAKNVLLVALPRYDQSYVLLPMFLAMLAWGLWATIKGVDASRWDLMRRLAGKLPR